MSCIEMGCEGHAGVWSALPWMISMGGGMSGTMWLLCRVAKACCNVLLFWNDLDMANLALYTYLLMKPLLRDIASC